MLALCFPLLVGRHRLMPAALAALLALLAATTGATAGDQHDRWYVLRMQDQRAGWLHDRRETAGDRIISSSEIRLELKRGDQSVAVRVESEFVETRDGKPLSMKIVQVLGTQPTTESYRFDQDAIRVTTSSAGATRNAERALPSGNWLTPAAAARFIRQRLEAGAREISVRAIDPTSGVDPVLYTNSVIERTHVEVLGKTVPAVKWRVANDRYPDVATVEYVDEFGVPIRSETSLGGLKVEILFADRELALSKLDAPELLVSTLVRPDMPIARPRGIRRATYTLSVAGGAPLPDLPDGGIQRVEPRGRGAASVTVNVDSSGTPKDHDAPIDAQREPSALVTSDDAQVKRLVVQATSGAGEDPAARAEAMRRFVHSHIHKKTLGVGFASAAEVARTRAGDCTEHAVLLAAMLRANGLASRVVSGLIYADEFEGQRDVFGYHMWTQAHLPGRGWTDLDATLPEGVPFDATHIALATSNLADGETTNALVSLVPLLGNIRIAVESTAP